MSHAQIGAALIHFFLYSVAAAPPTAQAGAQTKCVTAVQHNNIKNIRAALREIKDTCLEEADPLEARLVPSSCQTAAVQQCVHISMAMGLGLQGRAQDTRQQPGTGCHSVCAA